MNPMATSKADILKTSRELIQQNGWAAVNIRAVAAACGVSVGCIYNYFGSKTELVSAAVESIWNDIFHHPEDEAVFQDTLSCIRWMYRQMEYLSLIHISLLLQVAELVIEPVLQAVKAIVLLGALGDVAAQATVVAQDQQCRAQPCEQGNAGEQ